MNPYSLYIYMWHLILGVMIYEVGAFLNFSIPTAYLMVCTYTACIALCKMVAWIQTFITSKPNEINIVNT